METEHEVRLLPDFPATKDNFGPHGRIAEAIYRLISTESGGKAIALIGTWGAGKSTIINLLKAKRNAEVAVFIFDAWAHEGDPLRRTFLEKFISFLSDQKWIIEEKKWAQRLKELAQRSETTEQTSTPVLTRKGAAYAFALLLMAVGIAMLGGGPNVSEIQNSKHWYDGKGWLITSAVLTASPLLIIILRLGWALLCNVVCGRHKCKAVLRQKLGSMARGIFNKQQETIVTSSIKSAEPTSVEFQSWFQELAAETLSQQRRLALVIDNLDRVTPEEALKLWASMRAFIDFSEAEKPTWADQLWTIAAFDENAIKRLWQDGRSDETNHADNEKSNGEPLAAAFLEKTFQVRFRIPTPLLSDWMQFFDSQLRTAFPNGQESEFYRVRRIYEIIKTAQVPPTPRNIIIFINQIGAICRTLPLNEEIPLSQIALYVALARPTQEQPGFQKEIGHYRGIESYLGDNWLKNLSALHYGVPKEKAAQLELGGHVGRAITEGDIDELGCLVAKHDIQFVTNAVEQIVTEKIQDWKTIEPRMIGRAAYVLLSPQLLKGAEGEHLYRLILNAAIDIEKWPQLDQQSGNGLAFLIKIENQNQVSKSILSGLARSGPIQNAEISITEISNWLLGVAAVCDVVAQIGQGDIVSDTYSLAENPANYLMFLGSAALDAAGKKRWRYFHPGCPPETVITLLTGEIGSHLDDARESAIERMLHVACSWPWSPFISAVQSRLQNPNPNPQFQPDEIGRLTRLLLRLRHGNASADQALAEYSQTIWFFHRYSMTKTEPRALASMILATMLYNHDGEAGMKSAHMPIGLIQTQNTRTQYRAFVANPEQEPAVLESILALAPFVLSVDELLTKRITGSPTLPTINLILRSLASRPDSFESFSPTTIVHHYLVIAEALSGESLEQLLKSSLKNNTLEEELITTKFDPKISDLYLRVINIESSEEMKLKVAQSLRDLPTEDWKNALNQDNHLIPLVERLITQKVSLRIGLELKDALNDFFQTILSQTIPSHIVSDYANALFLAMTPEQQLLFKRDICSKIIRSDSSTSNALALFSDALSDCKILAERADDLVREGFEKILERKIPDEYQWLKDILNKCSDLLSKCHKETAEDFFDRIKKLNKSQLPSECGHLLSKIKKICGIDEPEKGGPANNHVVINSAFYHTEKRRRDVTKLVKAKVEDQGLLEIPVTNKFLRGDPDFGIQKTLTIEYSIGGEKMSKSAQEESIIKIG
jgi:hypothetical protein